MPGLRKTTTFAAALILSAAALSASAADESRVDLLRLFNSRLAENPRRFAEAARRVEAGAEKDLVLNQFAIAVIAGEAGFPQDLRSSLGGETIARYHANRSKIEYAAKNKGNAFAWYLLSLDAADETERMTCLRKAAAANNEQALNELGVRLVAAARADLTSALDGLRKIRESGSGDDESLSEAQKTVNAKRRALASAQRQAAGYFRRAADKSDSNGCCNYGTALFYGYGVARDQLRALDFLRQAARDGHPQAMSLVGECYRNGVGGQVDFTAALASFKQSAELGNASGLLNYGLALLRGEGVEADPVAALPLLKSAAERRLPQGMFEYGKCLLDGKGFTSKDERGLAGEELERVRKENTDALAARRREAAAWFYHCATDFLHAQAMERLATCLLEGLGVEKNERAAVYWYHRAAVGYDDAASMRRLAQCAEAGLGGVRRSHEDALWWLTRAKAAEGDRSAKVWFLQHDPQKFDCVQRMIGGAK